MFMETLDLLRLYNYTRIIRRSFQIQTTRYYPVPEILSISHSIKLQFLFRYDYRIEKLEFLYICHCRGDISAKGNEYCRCNR